MPEQSAGRDNINKDSGSFHQIAILVLTSSVLLGGYKQEEKREEDTFIRGNFYKHNEDFLVKCHLLEVSVDLVGPRFRSSHVLYRI